MKTINLSITKLMLSALQQMSSHCLAMNDSLIAMSLVASNHELATLQIDLVHNITIANLYTKIYM